VIYKEDQYGNLETSDNSAVVTVSLNSGVGPLLGNTTTTVAGGVATFTNLADSTAETITLKFASGCLTPVSSNPIVVAAPPTAVSLSPNSATEGGGAFLLTVNGTAFTSNATVDWNGTSLTTTFVSTTQLLAIVPASDISEEGTASITVSCPGIGVSNSLIFTITAAPPGSIPVGISTKEGSSLSGVVATFTDADPSAAITDSADYSLTNVTGRSIAASVGQPFQGVVASFTDSDPIPEGTSESTAMIGWVDGTSSTGLVVAAGGTSDNIQCTHTYAQAGTFTYRVSIADQGGATGSANETATVSTSSNALLAPAIPIQPLIDGPTPTGRQEKPGLFVDGIDTSKPGPNTVS
jgi:hypothetical protein